MSHLILSLELAKDLAARGWSVKVIGLRAVRAHVERSGFEFASIAPLSPGTGWTLLSHLHRCNRVRHRRGGPAELDPGAVRSGDIVADLTLDRAVGERKPSFVRVLRDSHAQLVIWDPTELGAPAAACEMGVPHLGVNFLATPPYQEGDWWCRFMARWRDRVRETRVAGPVRDAVGDYVDLMPAWSDEGVESADDIRVRRVATRPSDALFGCPRHRLASTDGLIVLSTAYRTENHIIRTLVEGVRLVGLRPVVVSGRSAGAPGLAGAAAVIDRGPVASLAERCAVLVTAAGSHSVVSAAAGDTPTVAVPVRVHSYWELVPAVAAGIPVCPADRLTAPHLADLITSARAPDHPSTSAGWDMTAVASALLEATG